MMKRSLVMVACAAGFLLHTTSAQALTLSVPDAFYLGFVDPATPADPADMLFYVNYLANLNIGEVDANVDTPNNGNQSYTFSRADSTLAGSFPNAILTGFVRDDTTTLPNVSGFVYVIAKYGTTAHVWVLNTLSGAVDIPANAPGGQNGGLKGLSSWTLFDTDTNNGGGGGGGQTVPDGGATLGLLGLAMLGLGFVRARLG